MKFNSEQRHEHNVTAELYRQLKNIGADVYMSYRFTGGEFDLVMVRGGEIALAFEIKNHKRAYQKAGAQVARYLQYGIPLVLVVGETMIPNAVAVAEKVLRGDKVEPLTRLIPRS